MAAEYRLSARADHDLTEIYVYTFEKFGELQADRYLLKLHDCMQRVAQDPATGKNIQSSAGDYRRLRLWEPPHLLSWCLLRCFRGARPAPCHGLPTPSYGMSKRTQIDSDPVTA